MTAQSGFIFAAGYYLNSAEQIATPLTAPRTANTKKPTVTCNLKATQPNFLKIRRKNRQKINSPKQLTTHSSESIVSSQEV